MNFLGIIWIASYVGSLFSPYSVLKTPEALLRVFPARVASSLNSTVPSSHLSQPAPGFTRPIGLWGVSRTRPSQQTTPVADRYAAGGGAAASTSSLSPRSWLSKVGQAVFGSGSTSALAVATEPDESANRRGTAMTSDDGRDDEARPKVLRLSSSLSRWSRNISRALGVSPSSVTVVRAGQYISSSANETDSAADGTPMVGPTVDVQQCNPQQSSTAGKMVFQVRVQDQVVAELPTHANADAIATQIKEMLVDPDFDPATVQPAIVDDQPAGIAGDRLLFQVDDSLAQTLNRNNDLIAIDWVNRLRQVLDVEPLSLADAQTKMYGLVETGNTLEGTASWYGPYFHGRMTANGEYFNQEELTAAHPSLPFNTYLKVTNLQSGDTVIVRVNDRGPYVGSRSLDLSHKAALCLDSEHSGVVPYEAIIMNPLEPEDLPVIRTDIETAVQPASPDQVQPEPSSQKLARSL